MKIMRLFSWNGFSLCSLFIGVKYFSTRNAITGHPKPRRGDMIIES